MWLIGAITAAACAYCGIYAAFLAKSRKWGAFAASAVLTLIPAALFALCVIFQ